MRMSFGWPRWVSFRFRDIGGYGIDRDTGHKQELDRHFSLWSLIGLAANCTISWTGQFGSYNRGTPDSHDYRPRLGLNDCN